jgi:hypothetical protein
LDKLSVTTIVDDDSYEHAEMVRRQSIQAVKMIEECFASKERRVQAMTGEGTVLDSIQFRNEVKKHVRTFRNSFCSKIDFFLGIK